MKSAAHIAAGLLSLSVILSTPVLAGPGAPIGWHITGAKPGATADGFGTLIQVVKADDYIGQRLRLSARLKSNSVDHLQLWFRVDAADKDRTPLRFNNMSDHPVTGTTDWKRHDIVLDVPSGSGLLNFGFFLLGGKGEGWADDFRLEKVDRSVPVSPNTTVRNSKPTNMNFDQ